MRDVRRTVGGTTRRVARFGRRYAPATVVLVVASVIAMLLITAPGGSRDTSAEPRAPTVTLVPVLVVADRARAGPDGDALERSVADVAELLARLGVAVHVAPVEYVSHPARAELLVDHTEAAAACPTVRSALSLAPRPGTVQVVAGGHISSTLPFRQLYGMACEGRSLSCPSGSVTGMVLVDTAAAREIELAVVVAHELGHVLGLRHAYEADCGGATATDGSGNLMALERDLATGRLRADSVRLADVVLMPEQVTTIRAP